jgi:polar amino acid transport system substrate-binding protein
MIVSLPVEAAETALYPRFRHIDKLALPPQAALPATLTLLADEDFAPFSFKTADGKFSGISVQFAIAACAELKMQCQLRGLPFAGLDAALQQRQGDVIIGGPQPSKGITSAAATRPYFFSYAAFFARNGADLPGTDSKSLAGRRIGFVQNTAQNTFLKKYYDRATLVPFPAEDAMFEALRTGSLDLAFADSLHGNFWLKGAASRNCCQQLGGAYADKATFTHGLVMLTRAQDEGLRDALDYALDRLQEKGQSAKIFSSFLPASPF